MFDKIDNFTAYQPVDVIGHAKDSDTITSSGSRDLDHVKSRLPNPDPFHWYFQKLLNFHDEQLCVKRELKVFHVPEVGTSNPEV